MAYSESAGRLKTLIEKAIEDHHITRAEMEKIIHLATEDGHIDSQEQSLLDQLHDMIQHKEVKLIP
jgi:hypothetical protein